MFESDKNIDTSVGLFVYLTSRWRSACVAEVFIALWANLFLLFIGNGNFEMAVPQGAEIQNTTPTSVV